jgi:HSP20 family protein
MWMVPTRRGELANDLMRMNTLVNEVFGSWPLEREAATLGSAWAPPVDVFENADAIKIMAELPGVKVEDVKISLENNRLTLRGEKKQIAEETTEKVHRYERAYGAFERTFTLPGIVDSERIQATYQDGILTVTLPKAERAKPREIPVSSK